MIVGFNSSQRQGVECISFAWPGFASAQGLQGVTRVTILWALEGIDADGGSMVVSRDPGVPILWPQELQRKLLIKTCKF